MTTVGSKEARQSFSQLLDEVEMGHTVLITRRGEVVARLMPIDEGGEAFEALGAGMWRDKVDDESVEEVMDTLRGGRFAG